MSLDSDQDGNKILELRKELETNLLFVFSSI